MIKALKRWRENRAAEKARIAACEEGRKLGEDLVEVLMGGRAPVGDSAHLRVTFPEWCGLVGTTTDEMAEAQERHEEEERGF